MRLNYVVIERTPDELTIKHMDQTKLESLLNEWGMDGEQKFCSDTLPHGDIESWPLGVWIIKGDLVLPRPVQMITTWKVP